MNQTRLISFIESTVNQATGFLLGLFMWQVVVAPLFGYEVTFGDNVALTSIFTCVSIARSYVWRRLFINWFDRLLRRLLYKETNHDGNREHDQRTEGGRDATVEVQYHHGDQSGSASRVYHVQLDLFDRGSGERRAGDRGEIR